MKRSLSVAAVLLAACLLLCSCGKKTKCSEKAVSVGKSAIEVADDYLDNSISADRAREKLDALQEKLGYLDSQTMDDPTYIYDYGVYTDIYCISTDILIDKQDNNQYSSILETRNKLAKSIGEKKKK